MKKFRSPTRFIPATFSRRSSWSRSGFPATGWPRTLHVSAPRVNDIVLGKRSISADTALRLSAYFGNSPDFWLGLQMDHDLWVAAKDESLAKVMPRAQAA